MVYKFNEYYAATEIIIKTESWNVYNIIKTEKMYTDYSNKNMMCKDTLDGQKQKRLKQEFC